MKKSQKLLALITALLMLAPAAVSCSDKNTENTGNETADGATGEQVSAEETEPETEERLKPNIPESADYGGDEIRFMFWEIAFWDPGTWQSRDIYSEGITGEGINDAVYNRNKKIEEAYKVKIVLDIVSFDQIDSMVSKAATSGDATYDVVYPRLVEATSLFNKGVLINIHDIPNIDLSMPWWDSNCADSLTVEGYLPCIATSINVNDKDATAAMVFSKEIADSYQIEDIYTLVREGKWTIDKVMELSDATDADLNGDGVMTADDQYGFLGQRDVTESFFYGSGSQHAKKDDDGNIYFAFGTERDLDVTTKIIEMMNQPYFRNNHLAESDGLNGEKLFMAGQGFLYWIRLADVTDLRTCDVDFGVVPIPKYEESQSDYYSMVSRHSTGLLSIPISITGEKLDEVGMILEAMAAESHYTLIPEYIETSLKTKYSRDTESADMLDIIISNRVYDPIYIYNIGGLSDAYLVLGDTNNTNLSSFVKSKQKVIDKQLEKLTETFASFVEANS